LFPNTYIFHNSASTNNKNIERIADVFRVQKGSLQSTKATPGQYRFITASDEYLTHDNWSHDVEGLVVAVAAGGSLGKVQYVNGKFILSDLCFLLIPKHPKKTDVLFYFYYFKGIRELIVQSLAKGVGKQSINKKDFENFYIDKFLYDQQKNFGNISREVRKEIFLYEEKIRQLELQLFNEIKKLAG